MGPQEQQTIQQIVTDTGVSWQVFKYTLGLALTYTTFAYAIMWKLFSLMRDERKDAAEGRKELWEAIALVKDNDIEHIKEDIAKLKAKVK